MRLPHLHPQRKNVQRIKSREAVAGHQVRNRNADFSAQVVGMRFVHHSYREGKAVRYAVIQSGKAAEISRLATYQGYIKGSGIT